MEEEDQEEEVLLETSFDLVLAIASGMDEYSPGSNRRVAGDSKENICFTKTRHHFIISDGAADLRPFPEVFRAAWWARSGVHGGCSARNFTFSCIFTTD